MRDPMQLPMTFTQVLENEADLPDDNTAQFNQQNMRSQFYMHYPVDEVMGAAGCHVDIPKTLQEANAAGIYFCITDLPPGAVLLPQGNEDGPYCPWPNQNYPKPTGV
jgi:hypothetical protein